VPVVSNCSPLIAFADINQLDLLPAIFDSILIPPVTVKLSGTVSGGTMKGKVESGAGNGTFTGKRK